MSETSDLDVYHAFIAEMEALTVKADMSAVEVVAICTRAVKRAQMAIDEDASKAVGPVAPWLYEALGRLVGRNHKEDWASWSGSYQQAYLRGYVDAMKPAPMMIDGDPMPSVSLAEPWLVLTGYLQQSIEDGQPVDPSELLDLMVHERRRAYAPVRDWWSRHFDYESLALGLENPPSPWDDDLPLAPNPKDET